MMQNHVFTDKHWQGGKVSKVVACIFYLHSNISAWKFMFEFDKLCRYTITCIFVN